MDKKEIWELKDYELKLANIIEKEKRQELSLGKEYGRFETGRETSHLIRTLTSMPFILMYLCLICLPIGTFIGITTGFLGYVPELLTQRMGVPFLKGLSEWTLQIWTKLSEWILSSYLRVPILLLIAVAVGALYIYTGIKAAEPIAEDSINWIFLLPVLAFLFGGSIPLVFIHLTATIAWLVPEVFICFLIVMVILGAFMPAKEKPEERANEMEKIRKKQEAIVDQIAREEIILNRWRTKLHENGIGCSYCNHKSRIVCSKNQSSPGTPSDYTSN